MQLYRVKEGDTLMGLARSLSVSPLLLAEQNGLSPEDQLTVGQAILLFNPSSTYTVKEKEGIREIAARHRLSLSRLLQYNPSLRRGEEPYPGQTLTLSLCDPPLGALTTVGFMMPGMEALFSEYCPLLSFVSIMGHRFNGDGELHLTEDDEARQTARRRYVTPLLGISPPLGEGGEEGQTLLSLLEKEAACRRLIDALLTAVKERGYGGVYLDLSFIPLSAKDLYTAFCMQLRRKLSSLGAILLCSLEAKQEKEPSLSPGEDTAALGRAASALMLSTHALSSRFGAPCPSTPFDKMEKATKQALPRLRPEKTMLALSLLAKDYTVGAQSPAKLRETKDALAIAKRHHSEICYDKLAECPYFTYEEEGRHIVFFEDVESLYKKLALLKRLRFSGVGIYPLSAADDGLLMLLSGLFRIAKRHEE